MFYNKSKVHLNLHPKERHGRAQAYAIANQMPVVGYQKFNLFGRKKNSDVNHSILLQKITMNFLKG